MVNIIIKFIYDINMIWVDFLLFSGEMCGKLFVFFDSVVFSQKLQ